MIITSLVDVAKQSGGKIAGPSGSETASADEVTAVVSDNRQISGGELFVAIAGDRVDGNTFANDALLAGATGVLSNSVDVAIDSGAPAQRIIEVDEPINAVGRLAKAQLAEIRSTTAEDLKVIGVTGSVGKTTTKDLLAVLLESRGRIIAPPGSFNNELGLPLTVLRADEQTATLVLEMGADHVGNLEYLTDIAPPDVSVVLAVGHAHLGEFGGIEMVAKAKTELVTGTLPSGTVILNADDERVRAMADSASGKVVFFSATGHDAAQVRADNVSVDEAGRPTFDLHAGESVEHVTLGLIGAHHVTNALAAASVALELGMQLADIARILSDTSAGSPHRMDVFEVAGATIIDDSYNANPESMRAAIQSLAHIGNGRRMIAVLGEMLELGEGSPEAHREIGELAAELGTAVVVNVGEGTAELGEAAHAGGSQVYSVSDIAEATELLDTLITQGDVVLLKGSNGSGIWRIADALKDEV